MKKKKSTRGGRRAGAGRKCLYPGKLPNAFGMIFTRVALQKLKSLQTRLKSSANDAIDHLLRYSRGAAIPRDVDLYPGKAFDDRRSVMLSAPAAHVLDELTHASGQSRGVVVEHLLRTRASTVQRTLFDPFDV